MKPVSVIIFLRRRCWAERYDSCSAAVHIFSHVEWHMRGYILRVERQLPGYVWADREERRAKAIPSAFRYYTEILDQLV